MTCKKFQGKTIEKVGLDLKSAPFALGWLHVPVGRVQKRRNNNCTSRFYNEGWTMKALT